MNHFGMKKIAFLAIGLAALALSACAPVYYDDRYGDRYYAPRGEIEYTDRGRYNDSYYNSRDYDQVREHNRDYRDHY